MTYRRLRPWLIGVSAVALALVAGSPFVAAQEAPRGASSASPLPSSLPRSVVVLAPSEPIHEQPDATSPRRGTAAHHARLTVRGRARGAGCAEPWLRLGPLAWICQDRTAPSPLPPTPARRPSAHPDGLPFHYYFVGARGTQGYRDLNGAEYVAPEVELQRDFAIAIRETVTREGERYGLTSKGFWLPMRDLVPANPSGFEGNHLKAGQLSLGWVIGNAAAIHREPGQGPALTERLKPFIPFSFSRTRQIRGTRWFELGPARWLSGKDVRVPLAAPLPANLSPRERWIDVDLARQILIAYEGVVPVFATLISGGKGREGTPEATPKGEHRIWVKLRSTDMDNLEDLDTRHYYAIQEVPWVMYFSKGYGLHGAFWHQAFGHVHSHGCVNLAPKDAAWLFEWTGPQVPAGWSAVFPSVADPGTRVRIR